MSALPRIASTALLAAFIPLLALPAAAAPLAPSSTLQNATALSVEQVQYRHGGRGYRRVGPGIGLGIAGALIGGAIIGATQPSYPYYRRGGYYAYPSYYPGYYPGYAAVAPYPIGDAVAYCMRRFRSYDPMSGTYLGFDGYRHACP